MDFIDSLFVTKHLGHGKYSNTLSIYASRYLADLEDMYGSRDPSFTLTGIDIDKTPDNPPRLWFPSSGIPLGEQRSKHMIIHLRANPLIDPVRARWQLAHECLHLLDPWHIDIDGSINYLEEGLATWYQNYCVPEAECHEGLYAIAENLVKPLMKGFPEAIKRIRQERRRRIGEITPDDLRTYCPGFDEDSLQKLCQPFQR